jgi:hypothetical protein
VNTRICLLLAPIGLAMAVAGVAASGTPLLGAATCLAAGAALAVSMHPGSRMSARVVDPLQVELMRCRRRGESAWVLVVRYGAAEESKGHELADCFRLTDSVAVRRLPHGYELTGVFEDAGLDRPGLERRIIQQAAGAAPLVGAAWRRFPDDGVTLEALLDTARAALAEPVAASPAVAPAALPATVLDSAAAPTMLETK